MPTSVKRILLGLSQVLLLMITTFYSPNFMFVVIGALVISVFWGVFDKMIQSKDPDYKEKKQKKEKRFYNSWD